MKPLVLLLTVAALAASLASPALARHEASAAQDSITRVTTTLRHQATVNRRVAWHWQTRARLHRTRTHYLERRTRSIPFLRYLVHWWHGQAYEAMHAYHQRQAAARAAPATTTSSSSVDSCLDQLIRRESGWNVTATNPSSGAYGLPQALPGSKMASAGADWATNPATQIRWMLGYVQKYGGSCGALAFQMSHGYY